MTGYFRVLNYNEKTGDLELSENGIEEPNAEVVIAEWENDWAESFGGRIYFRNKWVWIETLGYMIWKNCNRKGTPLEGPLKTKTRV